MHEAFNTHVMAGLDAAIQGRRMTIVEARVDRRRHAEGMLRTRGAAMTSEG